LCSVEHDEQGATRLALEGELDRAAGERLDATVHNLAPQAHGLILDLSAVTFMDCNGLYAILRCHQRCRDGGCSLTLLDPSEQVSDLLARVGLLDRLTIIQAPPDVGEHRHNGSSGDAA
jgi:anti-sigma B factor antagonist